MAGPLGVGAVILRVDADPVWSAVKQAPDRWVKTNEVGTYPDSWAIREITAGAFVAFNPDTDRVIPLVPDRMSAEELVAAAAEGDGRELFHTEQPVMNRRGEVVGKLDQIVDKKWITFLPGGEDR